MSDRAGTLGELLAGRRRRRFVGRANELQLFRDALAAPIPVLYVHGPGGIGKTALLDAFCDIAAEHGVATVRLDGRDIPASPAAVREALPGHADRFVLVIDGYERLAPLDDWLRTSLLPSLPASVVTVLASRTPPAPAWRADPGWRELLRVVPLRNLDPKESRSYLDECGVPEQLHDRIVETTHGHPLALSLLTDVVTRGGDPGVDPLTPDLVGTLLRRFLEVVPSLAHRRALEVCALARVTSEALLRDTLGLDDAHELFGWLRGLSFVASGRDGVFPHDLARDALDADLRWRDPEAYQELFRGIGRYVIRRLKTTRGRDQQRALFDAKFLHRHQPVSGLWADWDSFGQHFLEAARPGDRAEVLDLVEAWEGPASAALAEQWWRRQPEGFHVVRRPDGHLAGMIALVDLTRATADELAADPGASAAWHHAQRYAAPRPGEVVTQARFMVDREAHQRPSPTVNLAPVLSIQHFLTTPRLAMHVITLCEPERWIEYFRLFEIHHAADADFTVDGSRYGLFVRDFRRISLDDWLVLMVERDLTGLPEQSTVEPPVPVVALSRPEFEQAVRQALRDLRRRDQLARNPLVRSHLVGDSVDPAGDLADLVGKVVERLRDDPRDEKLFRVLHRTFLRPAPTQERAAELLDLPMTTYKRHLRRAVQRVAADLWEREVTHNWPRNGLESGP